VSTGQLFGVAGAAIGFFIGGPSGARMGYMIGSAVGTIVGPQVIEGPSLGDGVTQTAQAGVPRPIVYGTCAVRGNIIDLGPLIKRKRREQQGKGGPVVESERWLRTYAIRICEGPIAGVRRVWRDGKLVYDISDEAQRPEFDLDSWAGVIAQKVWLSMQWERKARFYLGTEDQPIDPALEAIHGVGQTPAYRGTPYMVVELDDITERGGSIPDYLFEVVSSGTVTETTNNLLSGEASELGFDGFFDGFTERVQYQAMPDNGAPIVRLQDFIIERIARIRVVPLYGSVVNLQRAATDADRDVLTQGVVFDSGWFAATEALADEFRSFYTSPPAIQVGAPADTVIRLPRVFTGLFVWVDAWQKVFDVTQFDAQYCDYSGPITFEHAPDVGGALLGSDGDLYWPPWVTPSPSRIIEANMIAASDIVSDICERVGITAGSLDVSQIATIMVRGYPLARQMSAADAVRGLMLPYMFDLPEWDKKLRAIPRGGAVVATITDDDLVDSDEEGVVRKQSLEFPRKLTLTAPDPTANHSPMSQSATRRSELVKAESEASIGMALSFTPDELAQIADMQLKIIWASAEGEAVFMLPEEWTWLTPTDCVTYRSKRYMIYQTECADGVLTARARYDRVSAYQSSAEGAFSQGRPSFQGIRGATRLEVMNLPAMRSEDDDCGLYVAAGGVLSTWDGCEIHVSVDGFQTYAVAATVTDGAVIGWTTSGIGAGVTGFPDDRSLTVSLPDSPESLTYEEMLRYGNLAIIGNEVLQYQDVVDNSDGTYTLTGLVRGGFDTGAPAHPANTRFVLFDSRVLFVPVPRAYIGSTLQVRAVTSGSLPDDSVQIPFEFAECVSQTEWPVVMVDATRDSSDNVTVTWVGRPRLGPETAPYHSRWFTGYRVDFSSGDSFVTFATSLTNYGPSGAPGVPTGATVTVTPTNAITGDGPTSEAITT
jgi:hypothetical protein